MKDYDLLIMTEALFGGDEKFLEWAHMTCKQRGEDWPAFTDKQKKSLQKIVGNVGVESLSKDYQKYMLQHIILKNEIIAEIKRRFDILKEVQNHVIALNKLFSEEDVVSILGKLYPVFHTDQCQGQYFLDNLTCIHNLIERPLNLYDDTQNLKTKNEAKTYRLNFVFNLCSLYYYTAHKLPWYGEKGTKGPVANILKIIPETKILPGHYVVKAVKAFKQLDSEGRLAPP